MSNETISRRRFVKDLALAGGAFAIGASSAGIAGQNRTSKLHLACNQYPWIVFYARDNRNFNQELDKGLSEVAASQFDGYEPLANNPQELDRLGPLQDGSVMLESKHFFSGAALYANGKIFASLSPAGFAVKLPADRRRNLIEEGKGTEFRFFPDGPIKREYVALSESIIANEEFLRELIALSIDYALGRTDPKTLPDN